MGDGEPHCLSVNKVRQLTLCESLNHRGQVFELSEESAKFATNNRAGGGGGEGNSTGTQSTCQRIHAP